MKQFKIYHAGAVTMFVALTLLFTGCKKSYDAPPETGAPNIVANTSIKDLKARFTSQGSTVAINDSVVISGIVNMDDKSGNYYQQISIQDETGGILLRLAGSNLNTSYPVGRRIYVLCKGLVLGDYGRMIQLGGGVDSIGGGVTLLAANLQDRHIIKGPLNQSLVPKVVTVAQLGTTLQDPYVNTLIQLDNFEFASAELNKNYADATASGNRYVQGCTSPTTNRLTLRTSNYANFATVKVPQGNGTLLGIYSLFNSTKQLSIRDTTDVMFYGPRCSGGGSGTIGGTVITLGSSSPYLINFDAIGTSLPNGVFVSSNATASTIGTAGSYTSSKSAWNLTGAGFKNVASANGLTAAATTTDQDNSSNRALAVRQTSTVDIGGDPGASFIFLLDNTTGKTNLKMDFQLQSLDATSSRTTTWVVEYAFGDNPTSFISTTATGTLTTGNSTFSNNAISVTLPAAVNNQSQKVWIRIFAKTATTGGGNRATTAIDDVKFTWN
jgi:hypothetical protein